jgi:adenylyltransferase/sulfurtransferase
MPQVGPEGQAALSRAKVLIVGVGGLGCPAAMYLAAAGVGQIGLVDPDRVALENLHRQLLYRDGDIGRLKVEVAAERLEELAPGIVADILPVALDQNNAAEVIEQFDIVLDGTDRFSARYAVNEGALRAGKPNVFAAVYGFTGQLSVFGAPDGPCYQCAFPNPPRDGSVPSCAEAGILGAMPGLLGTWQALEALKLILGLGEPLVGRMLIVDILSNSTKIVRADRAIDCVACSSVARAAKVQQIASSAATQQVATVTPAELKRELESGRPPKLLDVREDEELAISTLANTYHIPLGELLDRVSELNPADDLVVYCRSGARSANAASFLTKRGFKRVRNLETGINGWARAVDPSIPLY